MNCCAEDSTKASGLQNHTRASLSTSRAGNMFMTTSLLAVVALLHHALAAPNAPQFEKRGPSQDPLAYAPTDTVHSDCYMLLQSRQPVSLLRRPTNQRLGQLLLQYLHSVDCHFCDNVNTNASTLHPYTRPTMPHYYRHCCNIKPR